MKRLFVAAALTAAFAVSSALAQQGPWQAPVQPVQYAPSQAYGYAPMQGYEQNQFMGVMPGAVVQSGVVIGQDPDADVRLQLRREALLNEGVSPRW